MRVIQVKRISKTRFRFYAKASEMPKVLNGCIALVSTSEGVITDKANKKT